VGKVKGLTCIRKVLLNLLMVRLFLPLVVVGVAAIVGVGYLGERNLISKQKDVVQSLSHIVDYHIEQGERILDAVGRVAENADNSELSIIMKSTWEAYEYFDTIYYLDVNNRITLMIPSNARYAGLDMSNLPDLKKSGEGKSTIISRPFISLNTGEPTVYLVRYLSKGGCVIGELSLKFFQQEILSIYDRSGKDLVFIMDQAGNLIAHPSPELVKQQTNMSNLTIFKDTLVGNTSDFYMYDNNLVIGSSIRVEKTGWTIVDQTPVYIFISYYAWALLATLAASFGIWGGLIWSLNKKLQQNIINPLESLSEGTNALTAGDFKQANLLLSIPNTSVEFNKLSSDFQYMSNILHMRETALRESEKRYRGLFDGVPIGLFRASSTGEILDINPMGVRILGYPSREELLKVNISVLLNKASTDNLFQIHPGEGMSNLINFETELRRYDGTIITVRINTHIIGEPNEWEQHYDGSIEDITIRKQTEEKVKEQQELLFKAEKEQRESLEKALVMKDEFISLISHEFKTPLNVIYSAIQLIEYVYIKQIPERVKKLIGNIKQNTFRQLRLANNLLDVTRLNSGQFKLNMRNIDIVYLTKVITESVELYATQKNIKIAFESSIASRTISIDDEKYERIILNLLSNAIKFTESEGNIFVELDEIREYNLMQIKVRDTGIGIPKDKHELIFERFGQVDSNLSRRAEGTGIGLSLVNSLVNILEGKIELESELGLGTTFIITLPIKEEIIDSDADTHLNFEDRLVSEIQVQFSDIYF
jgi:PAS domain S-box-containing protein